MTRKEALSVLLQLQPEQIHFWVWLSPAVFAVHAVEDAPHLAEWMQNTRLFEPVTRPGLMVALVFFVALLTAGAYLGRTGRRWGVFIFEWMQVFAFLHGFAHGCVPLVIEYVPGLVTGIFLLLVSSALYHARKRHYFGKTIAALIMVSAVLLYDPVLRLAFKADDVVIHHEQRRPSFEKQHLPSRGSHSS